jgi:hypothetical protein
MQGTRLSQEFYDKLKLVDQNCDAIYDPYYESDERNNSEIILLNQKAYGAIHVWAIRQNGEHVHEMTICRLLGETIPVLERRAIQKLKECDIWKRFGDGSSYDDYLAKKEETHRAEKQRESKDKKMGELEKEGQKIRDIMVGFQQWTGTVKEKRDETLKH